MKLDRFFRCCCFVFDFFLIYNTKGEEFKQCFLYYLSPSTTQGPVTSARGEWGGGRQIRETPENIGNTETKPILFKQHSNISYHHLCPSNP